MSSWAVCSLQPIFCLSYFSRFVSYLSSLNNEPQIIILIENIHLVRMCSDRLLNLDIYPNQLKVFGSCFSSCCRKTGCDGWKAFGSIIQSPPTLPCLAWLVILDLMRWRHPHQNFFWRFSESVRGHFNCRFSYILCCIWPGKI